MTPLTNEDLDNLAKLEAAATPGPWFVRTMDDEHSMGAVTLSTNPDAPWRSMRNGDWPIDEIVAATLIQAPPYVIPKDQRWDENAELIATMRNRLPELIRLARLALAANH